MVFVVAAKTVIGVVRGALPCVGVGDELVEVV